MFTLPCVDAPADWSTTFSLANLPQRLTNHKKNSDRTDSAIYLVVNIDDVYKRVQLWYSCAVSAFDIHPMNVIAVAKYEVRIRN